MKKIKPKKVLISTSSFAEYDRSPIFLLESNGFELVFNPYKRKLRVNEVVELAKDCHGIIAGVEDLTSGVLSNLPLMKAISRCGAGCDNIDMVAVQQLGIAVKNTPGAPTEAVAELTVALILNALRRIPFMDKQAHNGRWSKEMGRLLAGKTIGVIGFGRIGRRVIDLLQPFGVKILVSDPYPDKSLLKERQVTLVTLYELLKNSDIVTLHIPYNQETQNLINAEKISIMKKGALLINTSRGGLINENDLYEALKSGHLSGVALDVTEVEPYNGQLKEFNNVILTPHIGSYAVEARIQMELEAAENLIDMLKEFKE